MDESSIVETTMLIPTSSVPLPTQDNRRSLQRRLAVYIILISTIFERLAFYSLAINLVVTLKSSGLKWTSSNSTTASFVFFGTSYISSIIFSAISDGKLRRAKTIIIGFILYSIGYILIILISHDNTHRYMCPNANVTHDSVFSEQCGAPIIGTLVFMAIGIGAVQVNMAVFGADQFREIKMASRYFDKYYVAVNIGATIATLSISMIHGDSNRRENPNTYFYGYLIGLLMLIVANILFIVGYRYYLHIPPYDSILLKFIPVVINAFQTRRHNRRNTQISYRTRENSQINQTTISQSETIDSEQSMSFLDYADIANNGKFTHRVVDDAKSFKRAIIVYLLLIPYWIIYYQLQITFPLQAQRMKRPYLYNNEKLPVSWISLGDSITIIIGILILNIIIYKHLDTRNRIISIKRKLILGMIFASTSMCITGIIEIIRQNYCIPNENNSDMSIFFQLPQNICMGLAEIFGTVGSLEFAYLAAPRSAQSLFMSLQFCSLGLSSFIGNGYFALYSSTSNFDFSCLDYNKWTFSTYFFMLAVIQIVFIIIINLCDKKFHILKLNSLQIVTYQFQRN